MTAKEWLNRAKNIDNEIKTLEEQKEILFSELTNCTSPTDIERVSSSKLNMEEEKRIKYIALTNEIDELIIALSDAKLEIIEKIKTIPESVYRTLLYERYINLKKWYQIAAIINYSESHTKYVLHNIALKYIKI